EIVTTAKEALDHFQCVTEDGKQRLLEHYQKSVAVPNYIRAALKALEKEIVTTAKEALDHFQCVTEDGKQRLLEHYQKSV
ncbi:hypothetical protein ACXKGW_29990, partial [Klebsiella pneumoniae subsp. pneumoniae]